MREGGRTVLAGARPASAPSAVRPLVVLGVPPALWFLHLNASYVLVPPSCSWGHRWAFAAVTAVALVGMVPGALRSWRTWHGPVDDGDLVRFLGGWGVAMAAVFALATLLVGASVVVISPCH